jgi:hypothetical protein
MRLHVITPLYRYEYIKEVFKSLDKYEDVLWHISKSNKREKLFCDFLQNNPKIILYYVDCDDKNTTLKRNEALKNIKDGYFCFVDDDTIFHHGMYEEYQNCVSSNYVGMIIGEQIHHNGKKRLKPQPPKYTKIDTGNVMAHHGCLSSCKWPSDFQKGKNQRDSIFWSNVYQYYDKKAKFVDKTVSIYNSLR